MNKNWYAVYTKVNGERKVVNQMLRKKIEHYCPLNNLSNTQTGLRKKDVLVPLFQGIVFVYTDVAGLKNILNLSGVSNILYWLGKPAIIHQEEIEQLQHFTGKYTSMQVEKIAVNTKSLPKITQEQNVKIEGKMVSVTGYSIRLSLPSIGFSVCAAIDNFIPETFNPIWEKGKILS
ncbi:MAG: hypothetical protein RLY16_2295 [Bacteroidota bacterium]|jgi:transcription antitermination factor NusG